MKLLKGLLAFFIIGSCALTFAASMQAQKKSGEMMSKKQPETVFAAANSKKDFSTLVKAIKAAGLEETLEGSGPYTVFAPTNQAFAQLPKGSFQNLLKPENKDQLREILLYHVVSGKITSSDIKSGSMETLEGQPIDLKVSRGKVYIGKAQVKKPDILAGNGVIHVINKVLMPPKNRAANNKADADANQASLDAADNNSMSSDADASANYTDDASDNS